MTPETARLALAAIDAIDAARALKKVGLAQGDIDAFDAIRLEITAAIEALINLDQPSPTSSDPPTTLLANHHRNCALHTAHGIPTSCTCTHSLGLGTDQPQPSTPP